MISDDLGKQLHDKSTRGLSRSAEEQTPLQAWYELRDSAASSALDFAIKDEALATLRAQVGMSLHQLSAATKRMQEIASENEALRQEITILRDRLVHESTLQTA